MANQYTYSYDDVLNRINQEGLYFSDADLELAQRNPDAGMTLANYKVDYRDAETDEARALANQGAEQTRRSLGGYSGGSDGSGFYVNPLSPSSFVADEAPSFSSDYSQNVRDAFDAQNNYGTYSYAGERPEFSSRYGQTSDRLLQEIVDRPDFRYDAATDPLYAQYRKQYTREGQRAMEDTLGAAAAASAGLPSSYAATAAAQQANYYRGQMTDKIPELYQLAYNKYLQDYQMKQQALNAVQTADQIDYNRYLNDMNQYNTDRSFDYAAWLDRYNQLNSNLQAAAALEQQDYNRYLDSVAQYNTDRNFNYGQMLDEIADQQRREQQIVDNAYRATGLGDYSQVQDLGINVDPTILNALQRQRNMEDAQFAADFGDYRKAQEMGINVDPTILDERQHQRDIDDAIFAAANFGDYRKAQEMGINVDPTILNDREHQRAVADAQFAAQWGDFDKLEAMGIHVDTRQREDEAFMRQLQIALSYASVGDYRMLNEMGIHPSFYNLANLANAEQGLYTGDPIIAGAAGTGAVGSGWNNGSLSTDQVREIQRSLGVADDGKWGPNTTAAAGGLTADEAWAKWVDGTLLSRLGMPNGAYNTPGYGGGGGGTNWGNPGNLLYTGGTATPSNLPNTPSAQMTPNYYNAWGKISGLLSAGVTTQEALNALDLYDTNQLSKDEYNLIYDKIMGRG